LASRASAPVEGSYTHRLLSDPDLLRAKLIEEAGELAGAQSEGTQRVIEEAADVMYFALAAATRARVSLTEIEAELDRRAGRVRRRPGNAKSSTNVKP